MSIQLKRAYDPAVTEDGTRYLVERLWPRGVARSALSLTDWLKDLAPSTELRRWYKHDIERWPEFRRRYLEELAGTEQQTLLRRLAREAKTRPITLVYATHDTEHSGAWVLKEAIEQVQM